MAGRTVYLISPANCAGKRAAMLRNDLARFELARQLRTPAGAALGDVFTFTSGLYFRGKRAYAEAFADPPAGWAGALVIAPGLGLHATDEPITIDELRRMASVPVDLNEPRYVEPLKRDAAALEADLADGDSVVLLGSIATEKYVRPLREVFGERLRFPAAFVGRGDMSRGGLLLRCAAAGERLEYVPIDAMPRRGTRPARLTR